MSNPGIDPRPAAPSGGSERGIEVVLRLSTVVRTLLIVIAALLVVGTIATSLMYLVASDPETDRLSRAAARFSISMEPNLLNFYSALALVASSVGLVFIAMDESRRRTRDARAWWLLAILLAGLGLDEYVMIHEMANRTLQEVLDTSGVFTFAWIIPAGIFAILVFFFFLGFLRRIDPRTARRFVLGGALVVVGAVGMEMAAGVITERWGFYSVQHIAEQVVEEGLEMLGSLVFLVGVLEHLRRHAGRVSLVLENGPGDR